MKKGDVVYCIKDFGYFESYYLNENDHPDRLMYKHPDGKYKRAHVYFIKGKSYVISEILTLIYDGFDGCFITGEKKKIGFHFNDDTWKDRKDKVVAGAGDLFNCNFDEYFVDKKEFRRMKLSELSDVNFLDFLSSIKNK